MSPLGEAILDSNRCRSERVILLERGLASPGSDASARSYHDCILVPARAVLVTQFPLVRFRVRRPARPEGIHQK